MGRKRDDIKAAKGGLDDLVKRQESFQNEIDKDLADPTNIKPDWDNPDDYALWQKEVRLDKRLALLAKYVPDRKCVRCQAIKLKSRQWVFRRNGSPPMICKACDWKEQNFKDIDENKEVLWELFPEEVPRFKLDPDALQLARERAQLTQREFARLAGWSHSYQKQLEIGRQKTIGYDTAEIVFMVLADWGVNTLDGYRFM